MSDDANNASLAARLARSFGDLEAMRSLYAEDVVWELPASFGALGGPYLGLEAVSAFNAFINTAYDPTSVEIDILDDVASGDVSVVRFNYKARMLPTGEPCLGEYVLFARSREGKIVEVQERLDTLAVYRVRVAMGQGTLFD